MIPVFFHLHPETTVQTSANLSARANGFKSPYATYFNGERVRMCFAVNRWKMYEEAKNDGPSRCNKQYIAYASIHSWEAVELPSIHLTSKGRLYAKRWLKLYVEPSMGSQISEENVAFPKSEREYLKKYMNRMEKIALACSRARRSCQKSEVHQANARARKLTKRAGKRLFNVIEKASNGMVRHFRELGDEWENLVLRVDDHTRGYPWELAFDEEDFMCTRFVVARKAVARRSIFLPQQKPLYKDALVIGIDYDWPKCNYSDLDHCEYEARSVIAQLRKLHYKIHPLIGKDATVEKTRKLLSSGVGVFHFTGHGNYRTHSAEGEKGLLCLADGELTTKDLRECFAKSRGAPYLSFLNACRSAKEIYSSELIDAFVDLGAENVMGTFWSVLDEPSKIFARKFYGSLTHRESIGFAIREAREQLACVRKKDEDTTWPAFVFYGDPSRDLPDARTLNA